MDQRSQTNSSSPSTSPAIANEQQQSTPSSATYNDYNGDGQSWYHGGGSSTMPSNMPTRLPAAFTHPYEQGTSPVVFIVLGITGLLVAIASVSIFVGCRKRKERRKETMANAYLEFSQSQTSHVFSRNRSNAPPAKLADGYYRY